MFTPRSRYVFGRLWIGGANLHHENDGAGPPGSALFLSVFVYLFPPTDIRAVRCSLSSFSITYFAVSMGLSNFFIRDSRQPKAGIARSAANASAWSHELGSNREKTPPRGSGTG